MLQDILDTAGRDGGTLGTPFPITRRKRRRQLWPRAYTRTTFVLPGGQIGELTLAVMRARDWDAMDRGTGWMVDRRGGWVIAAKIQV